MGCKRRGYLGLTELAAALAAASLKAYYSQATVTDLAWILDPTATLVGWAFGQPLQLDVDLGWRAADGSFVIAPACAGVNFLILVFTTCVLGFAHRLHTVQRRCSWFGLVACSAYLLTILVNALRIVVAVTLYRAEIHAGWLTAARVHRLAGTIIYLAGLWAACIVFDRLSARWRDGPVASGCSPFVVPVAYLGMTVVLPFLNGASSRFGVHYLEHAITVSLVALSTVPLLSLVRWATSWPRRREQQRIERIKRML